MVLSKVQDAGTRNFINLINQKFVVASADKCLYKLIINTELVIMLIVVVDDLLVAYSNKHRAIHDVFILKFKQCTGIKQFPATSYVGLEIIRDRKNRTLKVTQRAAIENLLKEHRFSDCTPEPFQL